MPTPTELAAAFRAAIDRQDAAALTRLAKTYTQVYKRLQGKVDSLLLAVSQMETPTRGQIFRLAQYKNLVSALESELTTYAAYAEVEIKTNAMAGVELAVKQTNEFLAAAGYATSRSLPTSAIYNMLGFLQEDSPLWKGLKLLPGYTTETVANALLEGITLGYSPIKTARMFQNAMGGGLTSALRTSRTTQLYAAREASRASYIANSDVVTGWEWWTALDADVCMACAVEHGTEHPLDEPMDSHYNCRCTSIPIVKGWSDPSQLGTDWFKGLPESQQREMMGNSAFEAWQAGKFELSDMSTRRHDDVYGEMLARTPLSELIKN